MKRFVFVLTLLWPFVLAARDSSTLRMKVEHMTCLSCAEKFKEELSSVCKDLTLDPQKGEAVCRYEAPVTPEQILKKANKTGFKTSKMDPS